MPVPSGTASLLDIQNEFGGSAPISLSEYYGAAAGIPGSGTISINDFRGKSAGVTISKAFHLWRNTNKGGDSTYLYDSVNIPLGAAWDGGANGLTWPRTTPFGLTGTYAAQANWPVYCVTYVDQSLGLRFGASNALYFLSNSNNFFPVGVTFTRTILGGGLYQNGSLLYTITSAESSNLEYPGPGQNNNAAKFFFNGNIWPDLRNRNVAGNNTGYEMRITYAP